MIRRLLVVTVIGVLAYLALLTQVLDAEVPNDYAWQSSRQVSVSELVSSDSAREIGQVYRVSGRVESARRAGKLVAVRLGDDGARTTIFSNDGELPRVGESITVTVAVQPSVQLGGWSGPLILVKLPPGWEVSG